MIRTPRLWKVGASLALALSLLVPAAGPAVLAQVATATPTPTTVPRGAFFPEVVVGDPTGPTPVAGGVNAEAVSVDGTPVVVRGDAAGGCLSGTYPNPGVAATCVPTPAPTETPRPTDTPIPPVATATPRATATQEAQGFDFSTATPAPGCIEAAVSISQVDCVAPAAAITPRPTDTPIPAAPTATPRATDTPIPAPTAYPTLAVNELIGGTGGQGVQNAGVALSTATPGAGTFPYCSAGGAGCVLAWATPTGAGVSNPSYMQLISGASQDAPSTTQYIGAILSTIETRVQIPVAAAHSFTKMYCTISAASGVGDSHTLTLRVGAADSTPTCTISGASATACNDTVHTYSGSAGDLIDVKDVTTGTAAAAFVACSIS